MGDDALILQHCAWCNTPATARAANCSACGAALAQADDLAGLSLPGVTVVEPLLAAIDERRHRFDGTTLTRSVGAQRDDQDALVPESLGAAALQEVKPAESPIRVHRLRGREQHPLLRRLVDGSGSNSDNIGRD